MYIIGVKEAAHYLKISYTTALKYIRSGALRAVRRGGRWFTSEEELGRFEREGNYEDTNSDQ